MWLQDGRYGVVRARCEEFDPADLEGAVEDAMTDLEILDVLQTLRVLTSLEMSRDEFASGLLRSSGFLCASRLGSFAMEIMHPSLEHAAALRGLRLMQIRKRDSCCSGSKNMNV